MRFYSLLILCSSFLCVGSISGQSASGLLGLTRETILERYGDPVSVLESSRKTILNYPQGRFILEKGAVVSSSGQFDSSSLIAEENTTAPGSSGIQSKLPPAIAKVKEASRESVDVPTVFRWSLMFADAKKRSEVSGLPILALFTGPDWCPPCIQLEKEALGGRQFKEYVRQNFIPLKIELYRRSPQSAASKAQYNELSDQYEIKGVPAFAVLSKEGELLGRPDIFKQYKGVQGREEHVIAAIKAASGGSSGSLYLKVGLGLIVLIGMIKFFRN